MTKPQHYHERLAICKKCAHYIPKTHCCSMVATPEHPTLTGFLDHPNGIINKNTRCPIRKFDWIPRRHAVLTNGLASLPEKLLRRISVFGITDNNILSLVPLIYAAIEADGRTMNRSEIVKQLKTISKLPND